MLKTSIIDSTFCSSNHLLTWSGKAKIMESAHKNTEEMECPQLKKELKRRLVNIENLEEVRKNMLISFEDEDMEIIEEEDDELVIIEGMLIFFINYCMLISKTY